MEHKNNNQAEPGLTPSKYSKALFEMFIKACQSLKTQLWLYYFMALEWITGPSKDNKERHYTTGIGLS